MSENNQRGADGKEIALEERAADGRKLTSPSVGRNRDVILEGFRQHMTQKGLILEIGGRHRRAWCASGSQHP